jgi:hypothetical protein
MAVSVQVLEETVEKNVALLEDAKVEFVSLVKHGASRMPFRVVKEDSDKEGGEKVSFVVQSIILPKQADVAELAKADGLGWLSEAKLDEIQKFEDYQKATQLPEEQFEKDSMTLIKLHKDGAWALIGKLVDGAEVGDVLTVGTEELKKAEFFESPMDQEIATKPNPAIAFTFRQIFEKELDSFLSVVLGVLNQAGQSPAERKKIAMAAFDGFRSFMSMGLDALGDESAKVDMMSVGKAVLGNEALKDYREQLVSEAKDDETSEEGGVEEMLQFKDQEEFEAAVKGVLEKVEEEKPEKDEQEETVENTADSQEASDATQATEESDLAKTVKDLAGIVKDLKTQVEGVAA